MSSLPWGVGPESQGSQAGWGWGLTAKIFYFQKTERDWRKFLLGVHAVGQSGFSLLSYRLLPSAQRAVPILPPPEPPGAPQQREPPPQPAGPAQHFRCPERYYEGAGAWRLGLGGCFGEGLLWGPHCYPVFQAAPSCFPAPHPLHPSVPSSCTVVA